MKYILRSLIFILFFMIQKDVFTQNYEEFIAQQKTFKTKDSQSIKYIDQGEGDVFLLLHGVPTSSWLYRRQIKELVNQGKRVIVPDLIGYGQSDKPSDEKYYHFDNQAFSIFELMKNLNIHPWTQVCHDMGSLVTLKMMDLDTTNSIKKIIFLNSIVEKGGFEPPMKFKKGIIGKNYAKIYCSSLGKGMIKATLNQGMHNQKIDKQSLEGYIQPLKKTGHHALYYFFTHFDEIDTIIKNNHVRLNTYKGDIQFIWGMKDKILQWKQVDLVLPFIEKECEILNLENSSHFLQEQELKF